MKSITDQLSEILGNAFTKAGYEAKYGQAVISGRPDLCQFQCNGALPNAKLFKKSPMVIANEVVSLLADDAMIEKVEVAAPGFINIILSDEFLVSYLTQVFNDSHLGIPQAEHNEVVVLDYGNPNVAKPLHVGHLRSTIIGESLKRIIMATGRTAIGDVRRFYSKKALVAYAGIDAPPNDSGDVTGRHISMSKVGASSLRRTLFLVMSVYLQNAPLDEPVYRFMDKKRAEGKPYRVYMMASANKFLRIYYATVKAYLESLEHAA